MNAASTSVTAATGTKSPAGQHGRHLTVVVHPAESQHYAEQQPHRNQHRQVLQRAEGDQFEDHAPGKLPLGGAIEHPRDLVGQQDHEQDRRDPEPGCRDLAENVAIENSAHGHGFQLELEWYFSWPGLFAQTRLRPAVAEAPHAV
jgi:hypothetical protein